MLPPCASADVMTPGTWEPNSSSAYVAWKPDTCRLRHTVHGEPQICDALEAAGVRSLLLAGFSTVRNIFSALVDTVLPSRNGTNDTPRAPQHHYRDCGPGATSSLFHDKWSNRFGSDRLLDFLCQCKTGAKGRLAGIEWITSNPHSACTYARRCGGRLEVHYWQPPEPFLHKGYDSWQSKVAAAKLLNASMVSQDEFLHFDAAIFGLGAHYIAGYQGVPRWHLTQGLASDVAGVAEVLQSNMATGSSSRLVPGTKRGVYLTEPRPLVSRKTPRWRSQTPCQMADVNAVATAALDGLDFDVVDLFELTHGLEEKHNMDGTHYDADVVQVMSLILLEAVLAQRAPAEVTSGPMQTSGEHRQKHNFAARANHRCRMTVRWSSDLNATRGDGHASHAEMSPLDQAATAAIQRICDDDGGTPLCGFVPLAEWFGNTQGLARARLEHTCGAGCPSRCGHGGGGCGRTGLVQFVARSQAGKTNLVGNLTANIDRRDFDLAIHQGVQLTCPATNGDVCKEQEGRLALSTWAQ